MLYAWNFFIVVQDISFRKFCVLLNNIMKKNSISKRGLFTPKCRSPPFIITNEKERMNA